MTGDAAPFTVRPSTAQKARWEDFIEESGDLSTLNGLVLRAVENELREKERGVDPAEVMDLLQDLETVVSRLDREVANQNDRLADAERTLKQVSLQTVTKDRLHRMVPEGREEAILLDELGEAVDEPNSVVQELMEQLVWEQGIESTTINEQMAYYR